MAHPTLREWLLERPFALAMSSGFFGFFAHCGVLEALEDEGLRPSRISGSSAGALVGGAWAAGLDASKLARELLRLRREDFWDPLPGPGLLSGKLLRQRLAALLPCNDFSQCRVPLALSTFDLLARRTRVARSGSLVTAIAASCAVPLLFHPVWIDGAPHVDGGLTDRSGLAGMPAGERVFYHHLESRSPWRRAPWMTVPDRPGMTTLVVSHLARVGPFRLHAGSLAYEQARRSTARALRGIADRVVRV